jgi:hypothetical protein
MHDDLRAASTSPLGRTGHTTRPGPVAPSRTATVRSTDDLAFADVPPAPPGSAGVPPHTLISMSQYASQKSSPELLFRNGSEAGCGARSQSVLESEDFCHGEVNGADGVVSAALLSVVQGSDAEHGVVDAVTFETAVAEDLPGLHAGEGVLDASTVVLPF